MIHRLLLFVAALAIAGCHIDTGEGATTAKPPEPKQEEPKVEEPKTETPSLLHPERTHQLADLKVVKLEANGHEIEAWLMDDANKKAEGMMFLEPDDVKENQGMLFPYPSQQPKTNGFWMKNTLTPLDIIYISSDRKVVSIAKGEPLNEKTVYATGPWQYVLELKQGMAQKFGIEPGTPIVIPPENQVEG
jgi:uncharacterized protein